MANRKVEEKDRRRTHTVTATTKEWDRLRQKASEEGLTISAYIIQKLKLNK